MLIKNSSALVFALLLSFSFSACSTRPAQSGDPKRRLNDYISHTFNLKSVGDRATLMTFLTGEAKARLGVWSDEQFRLAFLETKREFVKLVFNEIKSSPNEANITYELSYIDKSKSNAKITNKKLCTLVKEQGVWFIKDVRNIKELVEYSEGMDMSLP